MDKLIEKLSSYNLFNFIIPGAVYWFICRELYGIGWPTDSIIQEVFTFYFIGLIISRVGSLVIEPLVRKICKIGFRSYKEYIDSSKEDTNIESMSEINNTYRTMIALGIIMLVTDLIVRFSTKLAILKNYCIPILSVLFIILFIVSYRKQSGMINERISRVIERQNEQKSKETSMTIITKP